MGSKVTNVLDCIDIISLLVFGAIAIVAYISKARICIFYNIFGIPCPGCGLTRSVMALLHGNIAESVAYNILGIPIIAISAVIVALLLAGKGKEVKCWFEKHKRLLILLAVVLLVISWVRNLQNPLLY